MQFLICHAGRKRSLFSRRARARALQSHFEVRSHPAARAEGSGAPKGASNQCPRIAGAEARPYLLPPPRAGEGREGERARLPALHCGTRQRSRNRLWLSSRTTFPGTRLGRVFCPPRACPVQRAPRRPVLLPAKWCPEAARVRTANPPVGTALAPLSGVPLEGALGEQGGF